MCATKALRHRALGIAVTAKILPQQTELACKGLVLKLVGDEIVLAQEMEKLYRQA